MFTRLVRTTPFKLQNFTSLKITGTFPLLCPTSTWQPCDGGDSLVIFPDLLSSWSKVHPTILISISWAYLLSRFTNALCSSSSIASCSWLCLYTSPSRPANPTPSLFTSPQALCSMSWCHWSYSGDSTVLRRLTKPLKAESTGTGWWDENDNDDDDDPTRNNGPSAPSVNSRDVGSIPARRERSVECKTREKKSNNNKNPCLTRYGGGGDGGGMGAGECSRHFRT